MSIILVIVTSVAVAVGIMFNIPAAGWAGLTGTLQNFHQIQLTILILRTYFFNIDYFAVATKFKWEI